jgi:ubiquinone biosynthesis protein UbiJ
MNHQTVSASWWLWPWQQLLQQTLRLDPNFEERAKALEGSRFLVNIQGIGSFLLTIENTQLKLLAAKPHAAAEVVLTAPPLTLLRLLQGETALLADCDLQGDSRLLARWQRLFQETEIDWGEQLSRFLGVPLANFLEAAATVQAQQWQQQQKRLKEQVRDYLCYEGKILANQQNVALFLNAVDDLRNDLARLEQRLSQLEKIKAAASGGDNA